MKLFKRNLLIKSIVLVVSIVFFSSCTNTPKSLKAIPEDTNMVSVIDMYSIIKKGKLDEISNFKFFKTFKKELRNENKKVSKIMDNIIENPKSTGINFSKDLFMFYVNEAKDEQFFCISLDIDNEETFTEFLENILDESEVNYNIEKENNYNYTIFEREFAIAWDKEKAVLLTAENSSSRKNLDFEIELLFDLKEKDQILVNEEFKTFYATKKDVSVWCSTNLFEDNYFYKNIEREVDFDITNNYMSASLDFESDFISITGTITPNEEIKEMMLENNIWDTTFNTEILNFLPKESYANASMSIDPLEYYNLLKEEKDFNKIEKQFNREMDFNLKEIISSFKGNAIFSLIDIEQIEYETYNYNYDKVTKETILPIMGFVFDLNSDEILSELIKEIPESKLEKRNDYYEMKLDDKYSVYLAFNNEMCLITNDKSSVKAFEDGGIKTNSLKHSNLASNFSENGFYAYLNLDYNDYPKGLKKKFKEVQNSKEEKIFEIWNKLARSVEVKQIDGFSVEFKLTTSDEGSNSLNTLITVLDDNYKEFMSL